jgi:hypothetical protein
MTKKILIQKHSDDNYCVGQIKFWIIDTVLKSSSFTDLDVNIKKYKFDNNYEILLFKEFKFYNQVKQIEMTLADTFMTYLIKNNLIKTDKQGIKKKFVEQIKRYHNLKTKEEAEIILNNHISIDNDLINLLTPFCIFELSGYGLGFLISFLRDHTCKFLEKDKLVEKLSAFIKYRNFIVHNSFSSRKNFPLELDNGIICGMELIKIIPEYSGE